jgi:hypothetical protein
MTLQLALALEPDDVELGDAAIAGELQVTPWAGGANWVYEVRRLARIMQCRSAHHRRFERTCAQLTPWRLRSPVQCNAAAIAGILPLLEAAKRTVGYGLPIGNLGPQRTGWTRAEFGELLVVARNRKLLLELGRDRPKEKGPRFAPELLPIERLESLIQTHRDLDVVDRLRAERRRRQQEGTL